MVWKHAYLNKKGNVKSRHTISAHRNADALKAFINLNCGELMSSSDHAVHNLRREYHGRIGHLKSHTGKNSNYEETGKVWLAMAARLHATLTLTLYA